MFRGKGFLAQGQGSRGTEYYRITWFVQCLPQLKLNLCWSSALFPEELAKVKSHECLQVKGLTRVFNV